MTPTHVCVFPGQAAMNDNQSTLLIRSSATSPSPEKVGKVPVLILVMVWGAARIADMSPKPTGWTVIGRCAISVPTVTNCSWLLASSPSRYAAAPVPLWPNTGTSLGSGAGSVTQAGPPTQPPGTVVDPAMIACLSQTMKLHCPAEAVITRRLSL